MIEKDFIKREINQLGVALRKILSELTGLKNAGNLNQGVEISQATLKSELDLDVDELKILPTKTLIHQLTSQKKLDTPAIRSLSEIIFEISKKRKDRKLAKATLDILIYLQKAESVYSLERQNKIDTLNKIIHPK